ncbi:hypothetical protein GAR06_05286 [Micromonospora saelicesensis]|nr:hypothetical protein GAR06_05286 [Micromonospora saelicesensis]
MGGGGAGVGSGVGGGRGVGGVEGGGRLRVRRRGLRERRGRLRGLERWRLLAVLAGLRVTTRLTRLRVTTRLTGLRVSAGLAGSGPSALRLAAGLTRGRPTALLLRPTRLGLAVDARLRLGSRHVVVGAPDRVDHPGGDREDHHPGEPGEHTEQRVEHLGLGQPAHRPDQHGQRAEQRADRVLDDSCLRDQLRLRHHRRDVRGQQHRQQWQTHCLHPDERVEGAARAVGEGAVVVRGDEPEQAHEEEHGVGAKQRERGELP